MADETLEAVDLFKVLPSFAIAMRAALTDNTYDNKLELRVVTGTNSKVHIDWADSYRVDAFARLRVSQPKTIFDSKQIYSNLPLIFDDSETSGSGTTSTHSVAQAKSTMAVSAMTAGVRVRQSFRRFNYQPGKSQLIMMTGRVTAPGTGITQCAGYFDENDGIFFEASEGIIYASIRSSTSGSPAYSARVAQTNWNLDLLDGTGKSGLTLDPTKVQVFIFDFTWLGSNIVRFGFIIDGEIRYCHQENFANVLDTVYMSTPNLPIRYEISNDGTGAAATLEHICATVISEGGDNDHGVIRHFGTGNTSVTLAAWGTLYGVIFVRLRTVTQSATMIPEDLNMLCTTGENIHFELRLDPTIGGNALSWTAITNCALEYAIGDGTQTLTNGTSLSGGYFAGSKNVSGEGSQNAKNEITIGSTIAGVSQILAIAMMPIGSGSAPNALAYADLNYRVQA